MINQVSFDLLNGYILKFEASENLTDVFEENSPFTQLTILDFDNCFFQENSYILLISTNLIFRFESRKDVEIFLIKVVFFNIHQVNRVVFFERLEKEELHDLLIGKNRLTLNRQLSRARDFDVYLFDNTKVFSADVYGRGGELYQNMDDYLAILKYVIEAI